MNRSDNENLNALRKRMFLASYANGTTHLASAFSCTEILYALYARGVLKGGCDKTPAGDRDRLVLSKGHAAIALYAVLEHMGVLAKNELDTFLMPGTRLAGEPCRRDLPFIEASTGALGHGLSMGLGMALAQQLDCPGAKTFVLLGDGECQEGSVWEAAMSAAAYKADNLVAILDCNGLQKMCTTEQTMHSEMWNRKWEAFGWHVSEVDGHDVDALAAELGSAGGKGRPALVIARTVKGRGVSVMENSVQWHYRDFKKKDVKIIAQELGVTEQELEACREPS